jgi:UDP-N-acetyl-2-amino-2-deoxyglucuronate dehydrogenase
LVADVEVEDTAAATLRFDNGAIGSLIAGAHIPGAHNDEWCSIYGTDGQLCLPDPYGSDPLRIYLGRAWDKFSVQEWHSISLEPVPVYRRAIEEFAQAVRTKGCVPISAQDARRVLSIVLAIYQSSAERRTIKIF